MDTDNPSNLVPGDYRFSSVNSGYERASDVSANGRLNDNNNNNNNNNDTDGDNNNNNEEDDDNNTGKYEGSPRKTLALSAYVCPSCAETILFEWIS